MTMVGRVYGPVRRVRRGEYWPPLIQLGLQRAQQQAGQGALCSVRLENIFDSLRTSWINILSG